MPVKSYKPTSPGMRQRTTSDFSEITKATPTKSLTKGKLKTGGRDSRGHLTSWWRGGGHKKRLPRHRLQARQARDPGEGRLHRVRPEPLVAHRAPELRRRREALHRRAGRPRGRSDRRVGPRGRHRRRERAAPEVDPARHRRPQHRVQAGPRRADRPLGRRERPAHGQGGRLRAPARALGRAAPRARGLLRDDRPGRQPRAREHLDRQGRPQPLARLEVAQPRRRR